MAEIAPEMPKSGIQIYLKHPWNLIKTAFLVVTWIALGAQCEVVGPTMSILAHNTQVTFSGFASALASRAGGYMAGSVVSAIFEKIVKNHSEAMLGVALFLSAIVMFSTPFVTSLIIMCVLFFLHGLAGSFIDLGGHNLLLAMWSDNAAAPLNAVHLGYGFGAIFVNLLVRPFLGTDSPRLNDAADSQLNSTLSSGIYVPSDSNIRIPYSIMAGLCFLVGVGYLIFYARERRNRRGKVEIREIGCVIFTIMPVFISVNICLIILWSGGVCLAVAWMVYVWVLGLTATSLFVLGSLTGLVIAAILPLSLALINQRLNVVPVLLAMLLCGMAFGGIVLQKIAGIVMDYDPNHFPTLLIVCIVMAIILYIASNAVELFYRPSLKDERVLVTNREALAPEDLNEEQQMTKYLRGEEEKL